MRSNHKGTKSTKKRRPQSRDKAGRFRQRPQTVGRPTKYRPGTHLAKVEEALGRGLTLSEAAGVLGISRSTLKEWVAKYPEFSEAVTRGNSVADELVVRSLYTRAVGYGYTQTQDTEIHTPVTVKEKGKDGATVEVESTRVATKSVVQEIIVPGDVPAQQFWLKNRAPEQWREKQHMEHGGSVGVKPDLSGLTTEQLVALAAESKSRGVEESKKR